MTPSEIWGNAKRKDGNNVTGLFREAEDRWQAGDMMFQCAPGKAEGSAASMVARVVEFPTV